jgi:hypothetical protein
MKIAEGLITIFTNSYFKNFNNEHRFCCISGTVCCWVMCGIYNTLLLQNELIPIENLPVEKKQKYWDLAKIHNPKKEEWTMAAKSAYVLELITSTF